MILAFVALTGDAVSFTANSSARRWKVEPSDNGMR